MEVWDSPNSAGVMIDAIRCCKLALDAGKSGAMVAPSSYFMKSPPKQFTDEQARQMVEEYIVECKSCPPRVVKPARPTKKAAAPARKRGKAK
jgi:myo-inositol-1-phosphate synthase